MGLPAAGQVVVLPFPYSDLTGRKLRPAVLLAPSGSEDWIACQITSNPFSDPTAIELTPDSFSSGSLHHTSYLRPSKLMTVHRSLIVSSPGTLKIRVLLSIRDAVVAAVRGE